MSWLFPSKYLIAIRISPRSAPRTCEVITIFQTITQVSWSFNTIFIAAVCVIFLIELRSPKNKSLHDSVQWSSFDFCRVLAGKGWSCDAGTWNIPGEKTTGRRMGALWRKKSLTLRQTHYGRKETLRKKRGVLYGKKQLGIVTEAVSDMDALQRTPEKR